jgi:hypothetical protein
LTRVVVALALLASACQKKAPERVVLHDVAVADGPLVDALTRESKKAAERHEKPFVYIGATWCGPCNAIKKNLDRPLLVDAFRGAYVIHLDFDSWEDKLPAAGLAHDSVPVFFALDTAGRPTGRLVDGSAWGNDTPENIAPVLKAFFGK